jgi:hypothetical protein
VAVMTRKWERLPAPSEGVVSRQLGEEFVVLSTARNEAHSLSGPSAVVWRSVCDGTRPALPDEEVNTAVEALLDLGLLARPVGLSRRRVLQGGVVVTAVGISTIALPTVAAAASANQSYGTRGSGASTLIEEFPGATLVLPVNARNIVVTLVGATGGAGGAGNTGAASSAFGEGGLVRWALGSVTLTSALTLAYTLGLPGGTGGLGVPGSGGTGFEPGGTGGVGGTVITETSGGGGGGGGSTGVTVSGEFTGAVIAGGGGGGGGAGASLIPAGAGGAGGSGVSGSPDGATGATAGGLDGGAGGTGGGQTGNTTAGTPATAGGSSNDNFGPGGGGGGGFIGGHGGGAATGVPGGRAAGGGGGGAGGSTPQTSLPAGTATYGAPVLGAFFLVTYTGEPATGTGIIP